MDAKLLGQELQFFASSGKIVPSETQAMLCNSLTIAKHNNHFTKILFWGKIEGLRNDYFIAQGISSKDELNDRTTLYSLNGVDWHLLALPDEKTQEDAMQIRGRFHGDPAHEYEQHEVVRFGSGENATDDAISISVKEDARLATVIARIDQEAMIVPRGTYLRTPGGQVTLNESFSGMTLEQAKNLENWLHFCGPVKLPKKSLLEQADATAPLDFLARAAEDVPVGGTWSVQVERGPGVDAPVVKIRSLHWQGAESAVVPGTKQFSRVYFGCGIKNINLPFMLPTKSA